MLFSKSKIKYRIINVSYPRSGNLYLRNLMMNYCGSMMTCLEPYTGEVITPGCGQTHWRNANYIKTHDFKLLGKNVLKDRFPKNRKYLIQIRSPIPAIASWFELSLKNNKLPDNSKQTWDDFLEKKLAYWKSFYDLWIKNPTPDCHIIFYENLLTSPIQQLTSALNFIGLKIDNKKINDALNQTPFLQYYHDPNSIKTAARKIEDFIYYDKKQFDRIEADIKYNALLSAVIPRSF